MSVTVNAGKREPGEDPKQGLDARKDHQIEVPENKAIAPCCFCLSSKMTQAKIKITLTKEGISKNLQTTKQEIKYKR